MLRPNLPAYLKDVTFTSKTVDQELKRICRLSFRVAPFTAELAESLSSEVRRHLFRTTDGTPVDDIAEVKFNLTQRLQEMRIRLATDASRDAVTIVDVAVNPKIRVRRDKETPTFEANFDVDFAYPVANDLLTLVANINNQLVVTFNDQQTNMLDEQRDEEEQQPRVASARRGRQLQEVGAGDPR